MSFPSFLLAAPTDFNNDQISDPAVIDIQEDNTLRWEALILGSSTELATGFGNSEDHLAVASYDGANTNLATISSAGIWTIDQLSNFTHGAANALYVAGGDFDGDGKADAAYTSNVCESKRSKTYIVINPIESPLSINFRTSKGYYYKTFLDANGDGKDDFCWTVPIESNNKLTGRFKMICKDVQSNKKIANFAVKKLQNCPLTLRNLFGSDYVITYRMTETATEKETKITILNASGRTIKTLFVDKVGAILIGQYQAGNSEQIVIANSDGSGLIYNLETDLVTSITFPVGVAFDQSNINYFTTDSVNPNCFCSSKIINKNGGECQKTIE